MIHQMTDGVHRSWISDHRLSDRSLDHLASIHRMTKAARKNRRSRTRGAGGVDARARRAAAALRKLVRITDALRSPTGCPWDREQTHQTLRPHLIEETYEAL